MFVDKDMLDDTTTTSNSLNGLQFTLMLVIRQHQKRTVRIQFPLIVFLHLHSITHITWFMCKSFIPTNSFHVFLGLLFSSLNLRSNTFSPSHRHPFLKYDHTIAINFCTTFTMSSIPNCCLNSMQNSLSLNFTPHIHQIILISDRCNTSSFSLFNDHVSLPCNLQLRTRVS